MTKKARTFLTSFAGSIGIIGIALILSLSNGITLYINRVQEDTLSTYPLTIQSETMDLSSMFIKSGDDEIQEHDHDAVYSNSNMQRMLNSMMSGMIQNDLGALKKYFDDPENHLRDYATDVKYTYATNFALYKTTDDAPLKIDAYEIVDAMYDALYGIKYTDALANMGNMSGMANSMMSFDIMSELIDNQPLLDSQYDLVRGEWPKNYNEMVLVIDENNEIMDLVLYALGLRDRAEIPEFIDTLKKDGEVPIEQKVYSYDDLLNTSFHLLLACDRYADDDGDGIYTDCATDDAALSSLLENSTEIRICGIVRPSETAVASSISGVLAYPKALTDYIIDKTGESAVVKAQLATPETDIFTGIAFPTGDQEELTMDDVRAYIATLPPQEGAQYSAMISAMEEKTVLEMFTQMMRTTATYDGNLSHLGVIDKDCPASISIYPKDFASKEKITDLIEQYNKDKEEDDQISYTDYIGLMMSSITTIINVISYVLIAFVSISLIVSSIMIGIITYISVLERTKEIGILRAIGASKKDISRVFNAETLIVGLCAGLIGILFTVLLCLPINMVIQAISGISGVGAVLPWQGAIVLVVISMLLTFIAGLIPSRVAAKKDPVVALRSE